MLHLREIGSDARRLPARRRWPLLAGWLFLPLLGAASSAWGEAILDAVPEGGVAQQQAAASLAPVEVSSAPTAAAATAAKPVDAGPPVDNDQQRRVLLLLLMSSAGPVRPFGNFGR